MIRVALTGGIATGKSNVLICFSELSVPTVDADAFAREAVQPGRPELKEIRHQFGNDIFTPDGLVDRKRLAAKVFGDPSARASLEQIVHPPVRAAINAWFKNLESNSTVVFAVADIPLLFEAAWQDSFDRIIVTTCDSTTQLQRLALRDSLTEEDAQKRIAAQLPTSDKIARADFVIRTDGDHENTARQVLEIHQALNNSVRP